jgi:hypothetical protein
LKAENPSADQLEIEQAFYAGVYRRLLWIMACEAVAGVAVIWIRYERVSALTFLAGSIIAVLNFHWLKRTIEALVPGKRRSAWVMVFRFLLRYVLIALAAYVIFKGTTNGLYGFFAGLSVPVGAILVEAVYETGKSLINGTLISRN